MNLQELNALLTRAVDAKTEQERKHAADKFCHELDHDRRSGARAIVNVAEYLNFKKGDPKYAGSKCQCCGEPLNEDNPPYFVGPYQKGLRPFCLGCGQKEVSRRREEVGLR